MNAIPSVKSGVQGTAYRDNRDRHSEPLSSGAAVEEAAPNNGPWILKLVSGSSVAVGTNGWLSDGDGNAVTIGKRNDAFVPVTDSFIYLEILPTGTYNVKYGANWEKSSGNNVNTPFAIDDAVGTALVWTRTVIPLGFTYDITANAAVQSNFDGVTVGTKFIAQLQYNNLKIVDACFNTVPVKDVEVGAPTQPATLK